MLFQQEVEVCSETAHKLRFFQWHIFSFLNSAAGWEKELLLTQQCDDTSANDCCPSWPWPAWEVCSIHVWITPSPYSGRLEYLLPSNSLQGNAWVMVVNWNPGVPYISHLALIRSLVAIVCGVLAPVASVDPVLK